MERIKIIPINPWKEALPELFQNVHRFSRILISGPVGCELIECVRCIHEEIGGPLRRINCSLSTKRLVEEFEAKSNLLYFRDHVEITLVDPDGTPFPDEPYTLELPDGSLREGTLDEEGKATERDVPPGRVLVRFPRLAEGGPQGAEAAGEEDADEDVESRI